MVLLVIQQASTYSTRTAHAAARMERAAHTREGGGQVLTPQNIDSLKHQSAELRPLLLIACQECTTSSAGKADACELAENDAHVEINEHKCAYKNKAHEPARKCTGCGW